MGVALVVAVVVVLLGVLVGWLLIRRRRSLRLRARFGPEYDRAVNESGTRHRGEESLAERERIHDRVTLRPLSPASRQRYATVWSAVQQRFVDAPDQAVADADRLVTDLLGERGYPTGDPEARDAVLSVEHSEVMDRYRSAHRVGLLGADRRATTEQLRQAMVGYRAVLEVELSPDSVNRPE